MRKLRCRKFGALIALVLLWTEGECCLLNATKPYGLDIESVELNVLESFPVQLNLSLSLNRSPEKPKLVALTLPLDAERNLRVFLFPAFVKKNKNEASGAVPSQNIAMRIPLHVEGIEGKLSIYANGIFVESIELPFGNQVEPESLVRKEEDPRWSHWINALEASACNDAEASLYSIADTLFLSIRKCSVCADNGYSVELGANTPESIIASWRDSIAGPRIHCTDPRLLPWFKSWAEWALRGESEPAAIPSILQPQIVYQRRGKSERGDPQTFKSLIR